MIVPYLRQDLEIFRGNSREDGLPAWLLYDAIRNKYFSLGLTAFKLIKNWKGGEDIKNFEKNLYTYKVPNPDILIRTGGHQRLSNFLLWQMAYTELFFLNKLWPDFNSNDLKNIIKNL